MNRMMKCIFMEHQLVLSSYIVDELKNVVKRKDVDVFVTGDSDFNDVYIEKPEIVTPAEFVERYCGYEL